MKLEFCLLVFLLAAAGAQAQTNNLAALLQQGLIEEQANRNLDAAIASYQSLATQFDKDRQVAATAVFRLGECFRAQGKTNEAALQYQRILRDFPDQATLASLSRQNLAGMGAQPEASMAVSRQQQKELLAKQIALAEQDLADTQKLVQVGKATPGDARAGEREVLRLRQQLVALDGNKRELLDLAPSANAEEDQEIARIQQMIQDSPDLINAQDHGALTPLGKAAAKGQLKVVSFLLGHGADINGGIPPIYLAVGAGNRAMVDLLITRGADVNRDGEYGRTALYRAVLEGYQSITELLLEHHAEVNASDIRDGSTPLHMAVYYGRSKFVSLLLAAGARVNLENKEYRTPLSLAVENGSLEIVKTLLSAKADPNAGHKDVPLLTAIYKNNPAAAEILLQAGANPNRKSPIHWAMHLDHTYYSGGLEITPLLLAILNDQLPMVELLLKYKTDPDDAQTSDHAVLFTALGYPDILKALLAAGVKVDVENKVGRTPLSLAVENDSLEVVKALLAAKADPNAGRMDVPLLAAIYKNNPTAAEILLQASANPNRKSPIHWSMRFGDSFYPDGLEITPLLLAILNDQLPLVELLLKFKADPNDTQMGDRAVLFTALSYPDILKALLDAGAKVNVRDETDVSSSGARGGLGTPGSFQSRLNQIINTDQKRNADQKRTPLLFAAGGESNVEAVSELLQHGANPDATDGRGNTALHWAAMWLADERVFTALLEHKANPNLRNVDGQTPLDLVKERLHVQVQGKRFPNQNQFGMNNSEVSVEQKRQAEKLIALLHQHGALDNLPDWDRITLSRPSANASGVIFRKNTNDWNHFTLLEALLQAYPNPGVHAFEEALQVFPDLKHIVVVRPSTNGAAANRFPVDLLGATNAVDCAHDLLLEFGDVIEIPEREHNLAEGATYLTSPQCREIYQYLQQQSGEAKLVVSGSKTVSLPLQPQFSEIGAVLRGVNARSALSSKSDLSHIQVTRTDTATGKKTVWILDCSQMRNGPYASDLRLRNGDLIEVPEKRY